MKFENLFISISPQTSCFGLVSASNLVLCRAIEWLNYWRCDRICLLIYKRPIWASFSWRIRNFCECVCDLFVYLVLYCKIMSCLSRALLSTCVRMKIAMTLPCVSLKLRLKHCVAMTTPQSALGVVDMTGWLGWHAVGMQQNYAGQSSLTWQPSAEVQSMTVTMPHCPPSTSVESSKQHAAKDRSDDVEVMSSDSSSSSSSDE